MVGLEISHKAWKFYDHIIEHNFIIVVCACNSPSVEYQSLQEPSFADP